MWCIFENSSMLNSYIDIGSFRDNYSERLFPEFAKTPEALRAFIPQCTAGSWESRRRTPPLVAKGRKIVLRDSWKRAGKTARGK